MHGDDTHDVKKERDDGNCSCTDPCPFPKSNRGTVRRKSVSLIQIHCDLKADSLNEMSFVFLKTGFKIHR